MWADAVNAAYDAGITIVTAAGNNYAGLPTRHVVYPERFGRVIAACGVTNDFKPYYTGKKKEMQGCYGPDRHMRNALSAFTPNTSNTELSQLVYNNPELSDLIYNDAREYERISNRKWNQFKEAVIHHPSTSETIKKTFKRKFILKIIKDYFINY